MAAKVPWFERRFNFDFPVGWYPDLIERLRGTPARLEEKLRALSPDVLTRRERATTWSVQENAGHLLDLEAIHHGRLEDFLKTDWRDAGPTATLRSADLSNRKTHEAIHNATPLAAILSDFRRERTAFVERLERLDDEDFRRTALHPRLQVPMRLVDMLAFVAAHDDYHLARMTELIRLFARPG